MRSCIVMFLMLFSQLIFSQNENDDSFRSPLGIPLYLSGTFAELRANHFHGGIDIKTNGREGYNIYAAQKGFVSRIKVKTGGYGLALYVEHPSGYTTVYGHLSEFKSGIAEFVKKKQYELQSYEVDLYLTPSDFPVEKGQVIALSGNSGSSGGPHLHYEIRKTKGQIPINPLKYTKVEDQIKPKIYAVRVHTLSNGFYQSRGQTQKASLVSSGVFQVSAPFEVHDDIVGVSVKSFDKQDGTYNQNGFYSLKMYVDGQLNYQYEKAQVGFDETRYINAHVDYPEKKRGGGTFVNCFRLHGNQLKFIDSNYNDGRIWLSQFPKRKVKIEICDYSGNTSFIEFDVHRAKQNKDVVDQEQEVGLPMKRLFAQQSNEVVKGNFYAQLPANSLYGDVDYTIAETTLPAIVTQKVISKVYQFHHDGVPLHKFMKVRLNGEEIPDSLRQKVVMAIMDGKSRLDFNTGNWFGSEFQIKTRNFGTFFLTTDTENPTVEKVSFPQGQDFRGRKKMSFKIDDNISGIKSYRAEVDGQWILMEYDAKKSRLYHRFDGRITKGKHSFQLIVTDNVGNQTKETFNFIK